MSHLKFSPKAPKVVEPALSSHTHTHSSHKHNQKTGQVIIPFDTLETKSNHFKFVRD